jgi:hypothetical protein
VKRVLCAVLVCLVFSAQPGHAAGISATSVLPRGSHLLLQTEVAGYRHAVALAYRSGGPRIGVALLGTRHDRLIWSAALTGKPKRLVSPGPPGVFVVFTTSASVPGSLFAYRLQGGRISWVLPPGPGRPLMATSLRDKFLIILV